MICVKLGEMSNGKLYFNKETNYREFQNDKLVMQYFSGFKVAVLFQCLNKILQSVA